MLRYERSERDAASSRRGRQPPFRGAERSNARKDQRGGSSAPHTNTPMGTLRRDDHINVQDRCGLAGTVAVWEREGKCGNARCSFSNVHCRYAAPSVYDLPGLGKQSQLLPERWTVPSMFAVAWSSRRPHSSVSACHDVTPLSSGRWGF